MRSPSNHKAASRLFLALIAIAAFGFAGWLGFRVSGGDHSLASVSTSPVMLREAGRGCRAISLTISANQ